LRIGALPPTQQRREVLQYCNAWIHAAPQNDLGV
jgi:hypothetical protein